MDLKYIKLPKPLRLNTPQGEIEFSLFDFVSWVVDSALRDVSGAKVSRFNATGHGIRMGARIEAAFLAERGTQDGVVRIGAADLKELVEAAEEPLTAYPISPARRLARFLAALSDATSEEPQSEESKQEQAAAE